jgi:ankyrin repeat protein
MLAAQHGHVEVVRVLLEGGADLQRGNFLMNTAMHLAAWFGHVEVCRLLLDWGAEVNAVQERNQGVLHYAALGGQLSVSKLLVERGANVRLKCMYGETAADVARDLGHTDMADWLDSVNGV